MENDKTFNMKKQERDTISLPKKFIIPFLCVLIFLFIATCLWTRKNAQKYEVLTAEMELDTILVENPVSGNAVLTYAPYKCVPSGTYLYENNNGFHQWNKINQTDPARHTLDDIDGPYYMFKKANSNIITIIKNGYILKFKLPNSENQGRNFPPKSFSEFKENVKKVLSD